MGNIGSLFYLSYIIRRQIIQVQLKGYETVKCLLVLFDLPLFGSIYTNWRGEYEIVFDMISIHKFSYVVCIFICLFVLRWQ